VVTGRPTPAPLEGSLLLGRYDTLLLERGQIKMLARRYDESSPRKLSSLTRLLLDMLAAGPVLVAGCLTRAREVGISQRTLFEASTE
jgi:hypothetical protein